MITVTSTADERDNARVEIDVAIDEWLALKGYTPQQIADMDFSAIDDELNNLGNDQ